MIQTNPFTPQSGLEPKVFSGREDALRDFGNLIEKSKFTQPEHLVVLGEWGIGKTSLLKQFKKVAQKEGFWVSYCGINKSEVGGSLISLLGLIIEEIILSLPFKEEEVSFLRKEFRLRQKRTLSLQPEFAKFLIEVWNKLKTKVAFIFLDDIQNFLPHIEVLDILRATLSREDILEKTRFCFLLSSTPKGWNSFLDKHDPIGRFFRKKIFLEPFTKEETFSFIDGSLAETGVNFSSEIKEKVFIFTQGHPYEIQLLCSHLFDAQLSGKVDERSWELALRNTLRDLGREHFEVIYQKASEREKEILFIFCIKESPLSLHDLRSIMILERKKFPIANIKNFVYRLQEKGLLKRREDNTFILLDPLFREYILRYKTGDYEERGF